MASDRELFANFDRMRREMDELFGDVLEGRGVALRRRAGFSPRVDVYYCGDPPQAIVEVALAGVRPDDIGLEVSGRELVITGQRRPLEVEGRVYQQIEIEHGPFRRVVALGADVEADGAKAVHEEGMLRVTLPLVVERTRRSVPVQARGRLR